jgi:Tol biopolymer transport system component
VSDRRGSLDIYMTDLRSGFTDNMVLANSTADEQEPRFLGPIGDRVVFQTDRAHDFRIMVYDFPTGLLDTLPVANEVGSDSQLRNDVPDL